MVTFGEDPAWMKAMNRVIWFCLLPLCVLFDRQANGQTIGTPRLIIDSESRLAAPQDTVVIHGTDTLGFTHRTQVRLDDRYEAEIAYDDGYPRYWKELAFEVGGYSLRFDSVYAFADTGSVWVLGVSNAPMESMRNIFPDFYQKFLADGQCYYFLIMTSGRRRVEPIIYGQAILLPDSCRPPLRRYPR